MIPINIGRLTFSEVFALVFAMPLACYAANYYGGPALVMVVAAAFGLVAGYTEASRRNMGD